MSKVTDDWDKWAEEAGHLAYKFQNAVEYSQRDDEFAAGMEMMEFLQETVAALKSNGSLDSDVGFADPTFQRSEPYGPALDLE